MRDIFVTLIVFGSLPLILYRPYIGILVWSWLGYMNPHRLCWGFAYDLPFVQLVAIVTLIAMLASSEPKRIPWTRETILLAFFTLWMCITTLTAFNQDAALLQLNKVIKIQIMIFVTLMLVTNRERLGLLVWVITLSLAFYGVKGGIFTLLTGGVYRVMGPAHSFIGANNSIGLALLMILPLIHYLQLQAKVKWLRVAQIAAMLLSVAAILGSHSRGALVGLVAVGVYLALKSPKRFAFLVVMAIVVPMLFNFMPESWWERMASISEYQDDASAMGRVNAWWFAYYLALDRPVLGGGFDVFTPVWFRNYAPDPTDVHDSHSIYFEVLAEHGFAGLGMFLMLAFFSWRTASWVIRNSRGINELRWVSDLARMSQVSMVAFASAGAFLGLAYFDLYYHILAIIVICKILVVRELAQQKELKELQDPTFHSVNESGYREKMGSPTSL